MRVLLVAAMASAALVGSVAAQASDALTPGKRSIAFNVPNGGGGSFGYWKQTSANGAFGLLAGLSFSHADQDTETGESDATHIGISVGPALKRYASIGDAVAPFLRLNAAVGYARSTSGNEVAERESESVSLSAGAGIGVDWFPARSISLGGHTGVGASYGWHQDVFGDSNNDSSAGQFSFGTFTSALTLHIYF